jgi:hypothetical protein
MSYIVKKYSKIKEMKDPSSYIFKVTGWAEYLHGEGRLKDFECIIRALKGSKQVELSMIEKDFATRSHSPHRNFCYRQEEQRTYSHKELHARMYDQTVSPPEAISIWDVHRPLRVCCLHCIRFPLHLHSFPPSFSSDCIMCIICPTRFEWLDATA